MNPIVENFIWCVIGVFGGLVIAKLMRSTPSKITIKEPEQQEPLLTVKEKLISDNHIDVFQFPKGSAKEALLANVKNLTPLFDALNKGEKFNDSINDAIIEINNNELMNLWVKICKDHKAIIRILASWGIRCEDEVQFQAQKYHSERYNLKNGVTIDEGKEYKVLSPCWIYTFVDRDGVPHKNVIIKGEAVEI